MLNYKVSFYAVIISSLLLTKLVNADEVENELTSQNVSPQIRGTLYGTNRNNRSSQYHAYQRGLVFPRSIESNKGVNPWAQTRPSTRQPTNVLPKMPKGNPWAVQSIDQLEQPKDRMDKNPYTDNPDFNHKQQRDSVVSPYQPNYNSSYPMPYNNGYYSKGGSFPSPFDESFFPGVNQFWPGNNKNSFPFMPW